MDSQSIGQQVLLPEFNKAVLVAGVRHFFSAYGSKVVCIEVNVAKDLVQYYYLNPIHMVEIVDDTESNMRGSRHG